MGNVCSYMKPHRSVINTIILYLIVFYYTRRVRYSVIFHSCYVMLYCTCAFPVIIVITLVSRDTYCNVTVRMTNIYISQY